MKKRKRFLTGDELSLFRRIVKIMKLTTFHFIVSNHDGFCEYLLTEHETNFKIYWNILSARCFRKLKIRQSLDLHFRVQSLIQI